MAGSGERVMDGGWWAAGEVRRVAGGRLQEAGDGWRMLDGR